MAAHFVSTPGDIGCDHEDAVYAQEGKVNQVDHEFLVWLQKYEISPDGIGKIARNLSFKKVQTLATHSRSLAENAAKEYKLNFNDTVAFLDGINDLRKQQQQDRLTNIHIHDNNQPLRPHLVAANNADFIAKKQELNALLSKLDKQSMEQRECIDAAFNEMISTLQDRKRRILKTLETKHEQNRHILNLDDSALKQLSLNEVQQYAKYTNLSFHTPHKAALLEQISCFGKVKATEMCVPSLSMKTTSPNSVRIELKDEDLAHHIYKYEALYREETEDDNDDDENISWRTEVVRISNKQRTCTQGFVLQRLKPNQTHCVQVKKSNLMGDESVLSPMIHVLTNSVCNEHEDEEMIVYDEEIEAEEKEDEEVMDSIMTTSSTTRGCSEREIVSNDSEMLRWDKLRHGANVYFVNEYTVKTGEFALAVCDGGIITEASAYSGSPSKEYFIWEINVEKISKETSWIGYLDGPIQSQQCTQIAWNDCLTGGKRDHSTQYAIAFNRKSRWATLFGRGKAKSDIKLKSVAKNGDRFLFYVDFATKTVSLYQNEHRIGVVFTKISAFIVPAVSGRLATYSIKAVSDLSHIEARRRKKSSSWGWFG